MKIFKKTIVLFVLAITYISTGYAQENANQKPNSDYDQFSEAWQLANQEAIFEVAESPFEKPNWGSYTKKDDVVYALVSDWPKDGKLIIDSHIKVRTAFLDYGDKKLKTKLIDGNLTVFVPEVAPSEMPVVIKIQLTPTEDWANLGRYSKANSELKAPAKNEDRVVFIGNSITDNWTRDHGVFFEENPNYVNRGISGQTSAQMLLRFKPDVIELQPKVVIISAGTNDIAGNRGEISIDRIAANIFSMAELAKANNIKVILASVLPATSYSWSASIEPADKIIELNTRIKAYAEAHNILYLDYYTPMVNEEKGLIKELGRDTVHPNVEGYLIMEPMVNDAILTVLKK
ncbi:GDSL-type esterase/lipase family protein [Formosa sp. PL04]|uniref:GDSL-type esterase/lipase family protein n=1 Tax=Formosa sp. PL04 TaxID=3081755 RepID=UPI002981F4C0|nr:GDSL-type esterase/lipase family protein [Formosa sp. PL04]MDW5290772.1 GDSL-type esterase/lipase family protein [Formosa sp. PL04]